MTEQKLPVPGLFFGQYKAIRPIAAGGMGEVFEAHDPLLDRKIALKVVRAEIEGDRATFLKRFQNEAKTLAKISHPNVVTVFSYGDEQGTPYLAMEYIEGSDLKSGKYDIPFFPGDILNILKSLLSGVYAIHQSGIIHRDLKLSNIMIDKKYTVKITDFGVSKTSIGEQESFTKSHEVIGTIQYVAPEIFEEIEYSSQSDQFALGVIFFDLIAGFNPFFAKSTAAIIHKIKYETPLFPEDSTRFLSPQLIDLTLKLLAKAPSDRYPTISAAESDLKKIEVADNYPGYYNAAYEFKFENIHEIKKWHEDFQVNGALPQSMVLGIATKLAVNALHAQNKEITLPADVSQADTVKTSIRISAEIYRKAVDLFRSEPHNQRNQSEKVPNQSSFSEVREYDLSQLPVIELIPDPESDERIKKTKESKKEIPVPEIEQFEDTQPSQPKINPPKDEPKLQVNKPVTKPNKAPAGKSLLRPEKEKESSSINKLMQLIGLKKK